MNHQAKTSPDDARGSPSAAGRIDHDPVHLAQLIVDSAVDYAIITLAPDGRITSWNEGAQRIMGWSAEEAIGRPSSLFFVPEDVEAKRPEQEMRITDIEGHTQDERWHLAKGGRRFWASGRLMALMARPDGEGSAADVPLGDAPEIRQVGYLKILRDRTRQREEIGRQSALLALGDRLRDMTDAQEMASLACETLALTLGATRAGHGYLDVAGAIVDLRADWNVPGGETLAGRLRQEEVGAFLEELRRGEAVVMEDCRTHPAVPDPAQLEGIGVRALLGVPVIERGRLKAVMVVSDARPRAWDADQLHFVRNVADRTCSAIDRVRLEAERDLVTRELAHRMKNLLAIAQVIAVQSLRHVTSLEEGRLAVSVRLSALGRAQDMLTSPGTKGAGIRDVVEQALAPHLSDENRIRIDGPEVSLDAQQVLGLTLALHELATNASKYGALSVPDGRIDIAWTAAPDHAFGFVWTETGGPPITEPPRTGFGSQILGRVTGGYFDGVSRTEFKPEGLRFTLEGTVGH